MKLKFIIKKILYSYKASSKTYVNYLKNIGVQCGHNINIFCPKDTHIDTNNPYLLEIGNNVNMTGPVTILTHDYSTSVLNRIDSKIYGKSKKTVIGNNVFLGWGCTVLAGTVIEDNVIIGAGAVVSGRVEKNSVYAGNPAKKIMSISEYRKKSFVNKKMKRLIFIRVIEIDLIKFLILMFFMNIFICLPMIMISLLID